MSPRYVAILMLGLLSCVSLAQTTQATSTLPPQVVQDIEDQFKPPQEQMAPEKMRELLVQRMGKVMELGEQARAQYPQATDLHKVDAMMLDAAALLDRVEQTPASTQRLTTVARRLCDDPSTPPEQRLRADFALLRHQLADTPAAQQSGEPFQQQVRQFVGRYQGTPVEARATAYGAALASAGGQGDSPLAKELIQQLQTKYAADPDAQAVLRNLRTRPASGQAFKAELPRMDGTTLKLPDDCQGKVVVIDFWATWCGPCVNAVPRMKEIYQKYHGQGLEIVGVSLDKDRAALETFIREKDMPWIHTFSGKGWDDPTATQYGVNSIPNIWVVGKDGNVAASSVSEGALEDVIQKALANGTVAAAAAQPATSPATKPAAPAKPAGGG